MQTNLSLEVKYSWNQRRLIAIVSLTVKQLNKMNKFNRLINILYRDFTGVNCCLDLFADIKILYLLGVPFCYWNFLFSPSKASDANIGIIANFV